MEILNNNDRKSNYPQEELEYATPDQPIERRIKCHNIEQTIFLGNNNTNKK